MNPEIKPSILIVDDTKEITDVLLRLLSPEFNVSAVEDGETAIRVLTGNERKPDLILLDMIMAGIDGLKVCELLKANTATRDIPVIFLTGMSDESRISAGFAVGAVDYVRKPFNTKELMARIRTHIRLKQSIETLSELAQKLGKYLPPGLFDSIFSNQSDVKIASKRKKLTVCFTDIVGFTETSEKLSNRELTIWLNRYMNKMVEIALRYGGVLDKFIGDGILFFFGDLNHSDLKTDTVNCVKMVRDMIIAANEMGINLRAGINTGECHVGNFGSENHMEYGVIGKEVNIASRVESNSKTNRILITASTYELIKNEIPCEPRGEIPLKGIDKPAMTYWVL